MDTRPSVLEVMKEIAQAWSKRSTCTRLQVGAVAWRDNLVLATGYNGAPRGMPHCTDVGCLIIGDRCLRSIHAEENVYLQAARLGTSLLDAELLTTYHPCYKCAIMAIQVGIKKIYYLHPYRKSEENLTEQTLRQANIELIQLS